MVQELRKEMNTLIGCDMVGEPNILIMHVKEIFLKNNI